MILQDKKQLKQEKIAAGQLLVLQGSPCQSLNIIHQGQVEVLGCTKNVYTIPPEQILENSRRIDLLGNNSAFGSLALVLNKPYTFSYRTATDCVISTFPATPANIAGIFNNKLSIGMIVFRSLTHTVIELYKNATNMAALQSHLMKYSDNLSLAYAYFNPAIFKDVQPIVPAGQDDTEAETGEAANPPAVGNGAEPVGGDEVLTKAKHLLGVFRGKEQDFPQPFTPEFLDADHSSLIDTSYQLKVDFSIDQLNFYRRMLAVKPEVQTHLYAADINILMHMLRDLGKMTLDLNTKVQSLFEDLSSEAAHIVTGEYSFIDKYSMTAGLASDGVGDIDEKEFYPTVKKLLGFIEGLQAKYQEITRMRLENISGRIEDLKQSLVKAAPDKPDDGEEGGAATVGQDESVLLELKNSPQSIMHFAEFDQEQQPQVLAALKQLRETKNILDGDPDKRKLRRTVSTPYWEIYKAALKKWIRGGRKKVPLSVDMMLRFGYFDDQLISKEKLLQLTGFIDRTKAEYPVYFARDFLADIFEKKRPTSVNELGQTYIDILREKHNQPKWRKESDLDPTIDTGDSRLDYEIQHELITNARLTSGSPTTHFPILIDDHFVFDLDKMWVTRERVSKTLRDLLEIDYSLFYREVLVNDEQAGIYKEFVQTEVLANFVIVPSVGSRMMMWQDFESRSKQSPGRIMVPVFASGNLFDMLLNAMGAFRWEICKTIQGVDWNNVAVPSITADYMDYLQFFKKNKDLSLELKEKIHQELKKFRTDRDKFVNEYERWVKNESKGILKSNKVVRNMMYRHVPFSKNIRDELKSLPAYAEIATRFANIRNRKRKELETRYKKYLKTGNKLPKLLEDNLDFYSI